LVFYSLFVAFILSCEQAVQTNLGGVKMELEDATYPLLKVCCI
jgi:hypothetical protein